MLFLIISFYIILIRFDCKKSLKQGEISEKIIYSLMMLSQIILSTLIYFEVELKTPVDLIEEVVNYFKGL